MEQLERINGSILIKRSSRNSKKIRKSEFNITKLLLDSLGVEFNSDDSLTFNYITLMCGDKELGYSDIYDHLPYISSDYIIFRPLRNEKHANLIIDMFEQLDIIDINSVEIREFEKNGQKKYSGYFIDKNGIVSKSVIKIAPSIPILKISIVASLLFDRDEYNEYYHNLMAYLKRDGDICLN